MISRRRILFDIVEIIIQIGDAAFKVIADTTAMSEPHEIEYKLTCTLVED